MRVSNSPATDKTPDILTAETVQVWQRKRSPCLESNPGNPFHSQRIYYLIYLCSYFPSLYILFSYVSTHLTQQLEHLSLFEMSMNGIWKWKEGEKKIVPKQDSICDFANPILIHKRLLQSSHDGDSSRNSIFF
jgi:hypothetical protein